MPQSVSHSAVYSVDKATVDGVEDSPLMRLDPIKTASMETRVVMMSESIRVAADIYLLTITEIIENKTSHRRRRNFLVSGSTVKGFNERLEKGMIRRFPILFPVSYIISDDRKVFFEDFFGSNKKNVNGVEYFRTNRKAMLDIYFYDIPFVFNNKRNKIGLFDQHVYVNVKNEIHPRAFWCVIADDKLDIINPYGRSDTKHIIRVPSATAFCDWVVENNFGVIIEKPFLFGGISRGKYMHHTLNHNSLNFNFTIQSPVGYMYQDEFVDYLSDKLRGVQFHQNVDFIQKAIEFGKPDGFESLSEILVEHKLLSGY